MSQRAVLAFLVTARVLAPAAASGQRPVEIAFADPQPHFVAAWAPKKAREAERSAVLARRLSLELADVSVDAALKELTNQAGLHITYSPSALPAGKRVTIKASDIAVVTALTEILFRSGLDVVVDRDGALALVPCRHPAARHEAQDSGTIVGTVTDKTTGSPLAGATVAIERTKLSATTNSEGRYRIGGIEPGTYTVRARYIGYAVLTTSVTVRAGEEATAEFGLEKSVHKLDELVTTGTIVPTEVRALPNPVSVINEREITLQRPRTVQDVFRQSVPGSVSWDFPSAPYQSPFSARGATILGPGGQMKVFVDGIEVANPTYASIDPNSIGRMEVIRGPQAAAIYGSDAIGGVIEIFTKRGDPKLPRPEVEAEAALGIVQTPYTGFNGVLRQHYKGSVRGGVSDVSYSFGGGYTRTGDWLPNGEQSAQSSPSLYGGMRFARGNITADVSGRYYTQNIPSAVNPDLSQTGFVFYSKPLYQPTQVETHGLGARISLVPTSWWRSNVSFGIDRIAFTTTQSRPRLTTPDDTLLFLSYNSQHKRSVAFNTSLQSTFTSRMAGSLTVGFDHYSLPNEIFFSTGALNTTGTIRVPSGGSIAAIRNVTNNTGYFAQAQIGFRDALFVTGGLRAEQNTNFGERLGTPISPRVGLSFVQSFETATLKFRASYGRAIRAPAPGQKLTAVSQAQAFLANPLLGPERQKGWDTGLDLVYGSRASLTVTYYNQIADDLIQAVFLQSDPVPTFQFQNVGRVKNTGIEVEGTISVGPLEARGQYGYARARVEQLPPNYTGDLRVGDQVTLIPRHTAGASVTALLYQGMTIAAGLTYVGSWTGSDFIAQFRCFGGTGPCRASLRDYDIAYPGFLRLNASIAQQITPLVSGFLSVENITNNDAFEAFNFNPVMGRISTAGLRIHY